MKIALKLLSKMLATALMLVLGSAFITPLISNQPTKHLTQAQSLKQDSLKKYKPVLPPAKVERVISLVKNY